MSRSRYTLAIDQGTTSSKAQILDDQGVIVGASESFGINGIYPHPGWVEYDPQQTFESVCAAARSAVADAGLTCNDIEAIGLDNQGETVIAFDIRKGTPLGRAISWQDRRTEEIIRRWRAAGLTDDITRLYGLRLDPYFSAGKRAWILEHDDHAQRLAREGHLRLGTSDAWLVWMLTGGEAFVTDAATASRTMMLHLEPITAEAS